MHELRRYFTSEELDMAKEQIDGFVAEASTIDELAIKIRSYLDNPDFQE